MSKSDEVFVSTGSSSALRVRVLHSHIKSRKTRVCNSRMGRPTAEFFVDVTSCEPFGKFFLVLLAGFTLQGRCPARALTLLCGEMRVLLKKGDVNKKFRHGRGICRLCRRDPELHTLVYLLL